MRSIAVCSLIVGLTWVAAIKRAEAAPPEAPPVSKFAPADDLVVQVDQYIADLAKDLATEDEYKASDAEIAKQSNALVVLALALGLHDTDNKYKASAGALMQAAGRLAAAKTYDDAKKAVADLQSASGGHAALQWEKVASLEQLMKAVPTVHNRLKKGVEGSKFKKKLKATAAQSAALAVIAQGALADTSAAKGDEQVKQWYDFCVKMRDAAAGVNADIHKRDAAATKKAMAAPNQTCEDCHAVFKKDKEGDKKDAAAAK
jgi:hypothetical protein